MILVRDEDRVAASRKKKRWLLVYAAICCVYISASLLLLFLSSSDYTPFLVGDILLSIAFGWYSIYFFTVPFDHYSKWSRLMNKVTGALTESLYGIYLQEEEKKTIEGVEMRILLFSVGDSERELHLLTEDVNFEKGKCYYLLMQAGVIVEIGERNEKEVS